MSPVWHLPRLLKSFPLTPEAPWWIKDGYAFSATPRMKRESVAPPPQLELTLETCFDQQNEGEGCWVTSEAEP